VNGFLGLKPWSVNTGNNGKSRSQSNGLKKHPQRYQLHYSGHHQRARTMTTPSLMKRHTKLTVNPL
jgi:hypothetical protein